ncbi:unnamed protein product, partial [Brugia timori]
MKSTQAIKFRIQNEPFFSNIIPFRRINHRHPGLHKEFGP